MADINFSDRLGNIMAITSALARASHDTSNSQSQARTLESEIYTQAANAAEYQQQADKIIAHLQQTSPLTNSVSPESEEGEEILNPDGPTIGLYEHATFYQDGQTSTVFKARPKDPTTRTKEPVVALKVTQPAQMAEPHNSIREARLLVTCRHARVVPLLEAFRESGGRFVLVFPFLRHDLENLLRTDSLTPAQAGQVFVALFEALAYIHSLGIIHRDVKPSNILLRSMQGPAYLTDFGIAWSPNDKDCEAADAKITDVGTTHYRAPELLFGCNFYDTSLDIWAAGCVVAELLRHPHRPLFDSGPLGSDLTLIKSIFTTLGTPDLSVWPSAATYPDWSKVTFQNFPGKSWSNILPRGGGVDESAAADFLAKTVCFESTRRLTASQALAHRLRSSLVPPNQP